jgi:protein disulfide-isomerase-like protein
LKKAIFLRSYFACPKPRNIQRLKLSQVNVAQVVEPSSFIMVLLRSITLFLAVLTHSCSAAPELDADMFKALTTSGKNGMIKFYQPWCGHCTSMKPAWDEVSANAHSSVFVADVNCSDQDELCKENSVQGYPTIKVYKDGTVTDYTGGRTVEDLTVYVDTELAVKCDIEKIAESCSEKAGPYLEKWGSKDKAALTTELSRLDGLAGKKMTPELKVWFRERIAILQQLAGKEAESKEL